MSLFRLGLGADQCPIEFMDVRFTEHGVEAFEGLGCLRKDGYAADRTVEAVREAHEDLAGLRVALGYECLVFFAERFVAGLVALDDLPDLLVDYEKVVVFIKYSRGEVVEFLG